MAQKFRKKPVEIEAVQLLWKNWNEVCDFVGSDNFLAPGWEITEDEASDICGEIGPTYIAISLMTTHGESAIFRHGDWIIPDSKPGTFYPCKPDVFKNTYEAIDDIHGKPFTFQNGGEEQFKVNVEEHHQTFGKL